MEEDEEMADGGAVKAAIRSAKKSARPKKIGILEKPVSKTKDKKPRRTRVTARTGGAFDRDQGQMVGRGEGVRAKKGDAIGRMGKRGKGK